MEIYESDYESSDVVGAGSAMTTNPMSRASRPNVNYAATSSEEDESNAVSSSFAALTVSTKQVDLLPGAYPDGSLSPIGEHDRSRSPRRESLQEAAEELHLRGAVEHARARGLQDLRRASVELDKLGYFAKRAAVRSLRKARDMTRTEAGEIITRACREKFLNEHDRVSRFDIFIVARDIDEKHAGCWSAMRMIVYCALYFAIQVFQQSPERSVSVVQGLSDMGSALSWGATGRKGWFDVHNNDDLVEFTGAAVEQLYDSRRSQSSEYDALFPDLDTRPRAFMAGYNAIVGGMLLRQWRYEAAMCNEREPTYDSIMPACIHGEGSYNGNTAPYGGNATQPGFTFDSDSGCFIEYIDLGRRTAHDGATAKQLWSNLVQRGFIDKQTREMKIELCSFNSNYGLFAMQTFHYFIERGGRVVLNRELIPVTVAPFLTGSPRHIIRMVLELIFFVWVEGHTIGIIVHYIRIPCCTAQCLDVTSAVDLISAVLMHAVFVFWGYIIIAGAQFEPCDPDDLAATIKQQTDLLFLGKVQRMYNYLNLIVMTLMIFNLFGAFRFHKRLAIVTTTLINSALDLVHVGIVFGTVVVIYSFAGYTLVGRQSEAFASFYDSLLTLSLIALGEYGTYDDVRNIETTVGPIFFFSYILLVSILIINIVLAIVVSAFEQTQADQTELSSLPEDLFILMDRDVRTCWHYSKIIFCCTTCRGKHEDNSLDAVREARERTENIEKAKRDHDDGRAMQHSSSFFLLLRFVTKCCPAVWDNFPPPRTISDTLVELASSNIFMFNDMRPLITFRFFIGVRWSTRYTCKIVAQKLTASNRGSINYRRQLMKLKPAQYQVVSATTAWVAQKVAHDQQWVERRIQGVETDLADVMDDVAGIGAKIDAMMAHLGAPAPPTLTKSPRSEAIRARAKTSLRARKGHKMPASDLGWARLGSKTKQSSVQDYVGSQLSRNAGASEFSPSPSMTPSTSRAPSPEPGAFEARLALLRRGSTAQKQSQRVSLRLPTNDPGSLPGSMPTSDFEGGVDDESHDPWTSPEAAKATGANDEEEAKASAAALESRAIQAHAEMLDPEEAAALALRATTAHATMLAAQTVTTKADLPPPQESQHHHVHHHAEAEDDESYSDSY